MTPAARAFLDAPIAYQNVGHAEMAYRTIGSGPPVVFVHGWPLSGFTWRHVVARMSESFTCIVPDTPGAGDTRWSDDNDFSFRGQAASYERFVDGLGLAKLDVVAQDTGATIARELALRIGSRIGKMVLIGTEIPGHRPPFIPLFQRMMAVPFAGASFRLLLRSRTFVRSSMGFGGCFEDSTLLDGEFDEHIIAPLRTSHRALEGQIRYLRGIDWQLVDGLAERHREIKAPVLLVWGEQDTTFPVARAAAMVPQLANCRGLEVIPGARLLVHEERPERVSELASRFLRPSD